MPLKALANLSQLRTALWSPACHSVEPILRRKTRRRTRNKGYLLPFFHLDTDGSNSNVLTYCLETKRLIGTIALGFFGPNLKFIRGAAPPQYSGQEDAQDVAFDIVTQEYVPLHGPTAVVLHTARVSAHLIAGVADA